MQTQAGKRLMWFELPVGARFKWDLQSHYAPEAVVGKADWEGEYVKTSADGYKPAEQANDPDACEWLHHVMMPTYLFQVVAVAAPRFCLRSVGRYLTGWYVGRHRTPVTQDRALRFRSRGRAERFLALLNGHGDQPRCLTAWQFSVEEVPHA